MKMNSRERMLAAINRQPLDRVPVDIWATPEVNAALERELGVDWADRLHIDGFHGAGPQYIGPELPAMPAGESIDYWGVKRRDIAYASGVYQETFLHPLAELETHDDLESYQWPSADWFDYSKMPAQLRAGRETKATMCGYMAIFYTHNYLRGLELSLMDSLLDVDFTHELLQRISDFNYEHHLRIFETCPGLIDIAQVTDDLGSQNGPMISLETFRTFYKPHMKRFIDLCRAFDVKVFHHDDGAMSAFLPDLIEMGIDVLNPVQWNCPGMEIVRLKSEFGKQITFHGAVENQSILPFGTPEEVRAEVRNNIDILASDGTGYILAPCHCIQPVTPMENIIAMYDEAYNYGNLA